MPSTAASGSGSKRQKGGDSGGGPPHGSYHPGGYGPPQQRYQQPPPPYGGPPSGQPPPYGVQPPLPMWQPGQYGGQPPPPPPPGWQQPPPPNMYPPQRGGAGGGAGPPMTPDRGGGGHWNGYSRGPPPPPPSSSSASTSQPRGRNGKQKMGKVGAEPSGPIMDGPPGSYPGWNQWPQHQWGGGPGAPPAWQGGGPPPPPPPPPPHPSQQATAAPNNMYSTNSKMWGGRSDTPPRGSRLRGSPDHSMNGMYPPPPPDVMCQPVDGSPPGGEMEMYSRGVGPPHNNNDDDGGMGISSSNSRDKGRGSYKCGRCGVPKKGHVCPYQPKLKRRPEDPPPELRNAAVQVEMDEFLTLRRLNLKIQGFPESYATEPYMSDDMVIGEPHPYAVASAVPLEPIPQGTTTMMMMDDDGGSPPMGPTTMQRGTSPIDLSQHEPRGSPRSSPASDHHSQQHHPQHHHHHHHHPIDQDGAV